jgi:hypothetical protein
MFYVHDQSCGLHVFTVEDPRSEGYEGEVRENAQLNFDPRLHEWPYGAERPQPVLAVSEANSQHFQGFASATAALEFGYRVLTGTWVVFPRWSKYLEMGRCESA